MLDTGGAACCYNSRYSEPGGGGQVPPNGKCRFDRPNALTEMVQDTFEKSGVPLSVGNGRDRVEWPTPRRATFVVCRYPYEIKTMPNMYREGIEALRQ